MQTRNWKQLTTSTNVTPGNATALSSVTLLARYAIIRAATANTDDITVGPTDTPSYEVISAGGSLEIKAHPGTVFDLNVWFAKSTGASQNFVVIYQQ